MLCSCARHFVLTVPLSNQEYKLVPVYFQGSLMKCRGLILWWAVIPFRGGTYIVILLVTSCYKNKDNLRLDGPHLFNKHLETIFQQGNINIPIRDQNCCLRKLIAWLTCSFYLISQLKDVDQGLGKSRRILNSMAIR